MMQPTNVRTLNYSRNVVCGQCDGTGQVVSTEHGGHGRTVEQTHTCGLCRGGGMLTIRKSITIEIHPKHAKKSNHE